MANIENGLIDAHTPVNLSFLRNGDAGDVQRTSRASSIAARYYFAGIRFAAQLLGDEQNRIPACPAIVIAEAQVRSAFGTIVEAAVTEAEDNHPAGGAPFDAAAARTAARNDPVNRIEAIGLGAVHAALVICYHLDDADLNPTERNNAYLVVAPPVAAADAAAYTDLIRTTRAGWTIGNVAGHAANALTDIEQSAYDMRGLSNDESELLYGMLSLGQVAPVRAGAQLFINGHHYLSDATASARHRAIEKEVIARLGSGAVALWRANTAALRTVVWHAGSHCVRVPTLYAFAEDDDMPARLDATGYGSFSVGLPAQEDLFNRAGSYAAVYNQVVQTANAHGHTLSLAKLEATVTALSGLPRRGALPANRPALPDSPAAPWPAGCDTRAKALKLFLEPALAAAEPVAAWMFGFYKEICGRAGIRANSVEGSLLRSYSLKRAAANYVGEANRAVEMFAARSRFIRAQAEEGKLENYSGSA